MLSASCHSDAPGLGAKNLLLPARNGFLRVRCPQVGMTRFKDATCGACQLETDHHRFRLQPHAPDFLDTLLDLIFQGENFGSGGSAAVHKG